MDGDGRTDRTFFLKGSSCLLQLLLRDPVESSCVPQPEMSNEVLAVAGHGLQDRRVSTVPVCACVCCVDGMDKEGLSEIQSWK